MWDRGLLNGATQKASSAVNFHIGEVITSLQRTTLIPGGSESLVYTTLSGGVGMLVPFTSNEVTVSAHHQSLLLISTLSLLTCAMK